MWKDSRDNKLSKPSVDYQVMGNYSLLEIIAFSTESILDFQKNCPIIFQTQMWMKEIKKLENYCHV